MRLRRARRTEVSLAAVGLLSTLALLGSACSDGGGGSTSATSSAWSSFNHDPQNSRSNPAEKTLSPANVHRLAPRWRVEGLSAVTSTPAVVDGVVYFGDWSGVFRAVRSEDGAE